VYSLKKQGNREQGASEEDLKKVSSFRMGMAIAASEVAP